MNYAPKRYSIPALPGQRCVVTSNSAMRVRRIRERLGLSQEALAARLGVSFTTVSRWEAGKAEPRRRAGERLRELDELPLRVEAPARPAQNGFFGRDNELAAIRSLLGVTNLITVTGPGGCGKTRLVREVVRSFGQPVWFAELAAAREEAALVATVVAAVSAPATAVITTADLSRHLRDARGLLVLDNCEQVVGAVADLADALIGACPGLRILATSREPLRLEAETVIRLGLLALPAGETVQAIGASPSVQLFVDRAVRRQPEFALDAESAPIVAAICRELDGLPLAIELAAGRCASLSLTDLRDRLHLQLDLLASSDRAAPVRQQTLNATIGWSHALLSADEREVFETLGVFAGAFRLDAAEAVCAGTGVARVVADLVDRSLLQLQETTSAGRYIMLDAVRIFARECLVARGVFAAVSRRHAEFYLALGDRGGDGTGAFEARLRDDVSDFRQAMRFLLDAQDAAAIRLAARSIRFFFYYGNIAEGQLWLDETVERCAGLDPAAVRQALYAAGVGCVARADLPAARDRFRQALEIEGVSPQEAATLRSALALVALYLGDGETAVSEFRSALAVPGGLSEVERAQSVANLGWSLLHTGDLAGAEVALQTARDTYQRLGHAQGLTLTGVYLGDLALVRGEPARAFECYAEAMAGASERGEAYWEQLATIRMALVQWLSGDPLEGLRLMVKVHQSHRATITGLPELAFTLFLVIILAGELPGEAMRLRLALEAEQRRLSFPVPTIWAPFYERASARIEAALPAARHRKGSETGPPAPLSVLLLAAVEASDRYLSSRPGPPAETKARLSPREAAVLEMLVQGATNKEIARALVISPRTVERHLANVYGRIGARGRADAIAWALRT